MMCGVRIRTELACERLVRGNARARLRIRKLWTMKGLHFSTMETANTAAQQRVIERRNATTIFTNRT